MIVGIITNDIPSGAYNISDKVAYTFEDLLEKKM